jgi:hypothetical protein
MYSQHKLDMLTVYLHNNYTKAQRMSNLKNAIVSQTTTIYLVVLSVYLYNNYKNAQPDV